MNKRMTGLIYNNRRIRLLFALAHTRIVTHFCSTTSEHGVWLKITTRIIKILKRVSLQKCCSKFHFVVNKCRISKSQLNYQIILWRCFPGNP